MDSLNPGLIKKCEAPDPQPTSQSGWSV